MILSRFHLDMHSKEARKCLSDCQIMHRSIMRLFHCARQDSKVLYRLNTANLYIYILSEMPPDLNDIPAGMFPKGQKNMQSWEEQLAPGQYYNFDMLVSPAKKVAEDGAKNSRRRFLRTPPERLAWLERKAEQSGFALLRTQENGNTSIYGRHHEEAGGKFYCPAVRFQGLLQVLDREKFLHAWKNGIGPGRAYGQGMLLLMGK